MFALASALGGLAGYLIVAAHEQVTPMLGMWSTLKGMIAMMLGGLGSLPGAVVGGLALGLIEAHSQWLFGPQYRDLIAYFVLFALLAARPRRAVGDARAPAAARLTMDEYALGVLTNIGLFSFLALSAYLLLIAGEMSFGQQAFFGVGAYAAGIGTAMWGLPLPLARCSSRWRSALRRHGSSACRPCGCAGSTSRWRRSLRPRCSGSCSSSSTGSARSTASRSGPDGTQGFRGIRWVLEQGIEQAGYRRDRLRAPRAGARGASSSPSARGSARPCGWSARTRSSRRCSASTCTRVKLGVAAVAGALAALGGALYAHHNTYIEPRNFDIMLGVHSLAYALIGGLGTALGPLLGVALDIGLLESTRVFQGYRMIVFGGLVALLLDRPAARAARRDRRSTASPDASGAGAASVSALARRARALPRRRARRRAAPRRRRRLQADEARPRLRLPDRAQGSEVGQAGGRRGGLGRRRHAVDADGAQREAGEGEAGRRAGRVRARASSSRCSASGRSSSTSAARRAT